MQRIETQDGLALIWVGRAFKAELLLRALPFKHRFPSRQNNPKHRYNTGAVMQNLRRMNFKSVHLHFAVNVF